MPMTVDSKNCVCYCHVPLKESILDANVVSVSESIQPPTNPYYTQVAILQSGNDD